MKPFQQASCSSAVPARQHTSAQRFDATRSEPLGEV